MAQRQQRGLLKKEIRIPGETWVLHFRATRKSDSRRVENKIPIGLVRDFPDKRTAWAEVERLHLPINPVDSRRGVTFGDLVLHYAEHELVEWSEPIHPKAHTTIKGYDRILRNRLLPNRKAKTNAKTFPKNEKAKTTQRMSNSTKFEERASSSRSTHEGEPSESLCDRLSRTRDTSQRQLPTDQDYAVSTREYQTDQSSLKHASTAACPVLEKQQKQLQRQKQPHRVAGMDRVTPYQRFLTR